MTTFKYEVAISCRQEDEPFARKLYDRLVGRVRSIFLYTQEQKALIGEDGLDAFGQVYSNESRIVVVIFGEGWGDTKWTGVEDRAIRHLYFNNEWRRVLVYCVGKAKPKWLPDTYLYAGPETSLETLATIIERKVAEEGGTVGDEDVLLKAARLGEEQAAAERRERRRSSAEAVAAGSTEFSACARQLEAQAAAITALGTMKVTFGLVSGIPSVRTELATIELNWGGWASNSVVGGELQTLLALESLSPHGWTERKERTVAKYELHLSEDERTWLWVDSQGRRYTSVAVADRAISFLLDEHKRKHEAGLQRTRKVYY